MKINFICSESSGYNPNPAKSAPLPSLWGKAPGDGGLIAQITFCMTNLELLRTQRTPSSQEIHPLKNLCTDGKTCKIFLSYSLGVLGGKKILWKVRTYSI